MTIAVGLILGVQIAGVGFILIANAVHKHRHHRDLLDTKALRLQFVGPEDVRLQDPHAYAREVGLVVSGCLNRYSPRDAPVADEVDVRILSSTGTVLHETAIHDLSRCKRGGVHFNATFGAIPPDGSILDIRALAQKANDSAGNLSTRDPGG